MILEQVERSLWGGEYQLLQTVQMELLLSINHLDQVYEEDIKEIIKGNKEDIMDIITDLTESMTSLAPVSTSNLTTSRTFKRK